MAASENGRFEHQFRILLVVVALDLVVSLLLWGTLGGRQALGFFAVTTALLFLYTLFFCERMPLCTDEHVAGSKSLANESGVCCTRGSGLPEET